MTEDEAKTKWCPFARCASAVAGLEGACVREHLPSLNRIALPADLMVPSAARCIGSACMAWRWDEPWTSRTEEGHGGDIVIRLKRKPGEPRLGFCGMAGAPR